MEQTMKVNRMRCPKCGRHNTIHAIKLGPGDFLYSCDACGHEIRGQQKEVAREDVEVPKRTE